MVDLSEVFRRLLAETIELLIHRRDSFREYSDCVAHVLDSDLSLSNVVFHTAQATLNVLEPGVHLFESGVDLFEPTIDLFESAIDLFEPSVHVLPQSTEPVIQKSCQFLVFHSTSFCATSYLGRSRYTTRRL